MLYPFIKRLFDVTCAGLGLILLAPLGLLLALLVKLSDGGPVLFGQIRVGQFGRPFRIWKFRSMVVNADRLGLSLTSQEDRRITRIGKFLRNTKLDELPQLWNVLTGSMSFVGPRPEVPEYVDRYTPKQREILKLKPGITDLASMLFRNEESLLRGSGDTEGFYLRYCLPKKIELNLQYSKRAGLLQDIWIILQTLCPYWLAVLGIYSFALTLSLWASYLLRFDFRLARREYEAILRCLPFMLVPQLALLVFRGQHRGLISYFSVPEIARTFSALAIALVIQFATWALSEGRLTPSPGLVLIHFLLSFFALCAIRMGARLLRERYSFSVSGDHVPPWRVAIVGTSRMATKLALDLMNNQNAPTRVLAFFDDDPYTWQKRPHDIPVLGMPECLLNNEWNDRIDEVIVALPEEDSTRVKEVLNLLKSSSFKVSCAPSWPSLDPAASA